MATAPSSSSNVRAWGLLSHKPRWGLTVRGYLLTFGVLLLSAVTCVLDVHPFLALNHPLHSQVLVVEGWIPDHAFQEVVREVNRGGYKTVYTTGGPITWQSASRYGGTYAGYSAVRLQRAGIPTNMVVAVSADFPDWERTYRSALALDSYFTNSGCAPPNLNVITSGPHARRTRLLYERAFHNRIKVGIISIPRDDYDPNHWWRTSAGLREVISETAAYLYCRIIPSAFTD